MLRLIYKSITDEECYQNLKRVSNSVFMNAESRKKLRLIELNKMGLVWSS